jgi:hypothetical protein
LLTGANLSSLGLSGAGNPFAVSRGGFTTHGCTWNSSAGTLHLQYERADPTALRQVKDSLGGTGERVPGIGSYAVGQFGSVLDALNFVTGTTFGSMEFFGSAAAANKAAFLAVAGDFASRL